MTLRFTRFLILVTLFSLLAAGCARPTNATVQPAATGAANGPHLPDSSSSTVGNTAALENTPWLLRDFATDSLKPLLAIYSVTLQLNPADITASGVSACNRYSSPYTLEGNQLSFGPVMSTLMACRAMQSTVESTYQAALAQVVGYRLEAGSLELLDADGKMLLRFVVDPFTLSKTFTYEELANATIHSPLSESGVVTLSNGEYRQVSADNTASDEAVNLTNYVVFGDVTADGQEDAVAILVTATGGSAFYSLAVLQRQGDQWVDAQIMFGEQVRVNSLQLAGDQIVVDMLMKGPGDPACCPSVQTVQRYHWTGAQLELVDLIESR